MLEQIRAIMKDIPKLSGIALEIADDADLWNAGMDSITSVQLLLRVEESFDVELPDEALTRDTFRSIRALSDALTSQLQGTPAP